MGDYTRATNLELSLVFRLLKSLDIFPLQFCSGQSLHPSSCFLLFILVGRKHQVYSKFLFSQKTLCLLPKAHEASLLPGENVSIWRELTYNSIRIPHRMYTFFLVLFLVDYQQFLLRMKEKRKTERTTESFPYPTVYIKASKELNMK